MANSESSDVYVNYSKAEGFTGLWIAAAACFVLALLVLLANSLKKDEIDRQLKQG